MNERDSKQVAQEQIVSSVSAAKKHWAKGDIGKSILALLGAGSAGLDYLMEMIQELAPTTFPKYLSYTEKFFDSFVQDACRKENLKFIGGTLKMKLERETGIRLLAELYFQNDKKEWIKKTRKGYIDKKVFSDWDTDPDVQDLKRHKGLEYPINPPEGT